MRTREGPLSGVARPGTGSRAVTCRGRRRLGLRGPAPDAHRGFAIRICLQGLRPSADLFLQLGQWSSLPLSTSQQLSEEPDI